jgi:hypothetical protein
MTNLHFRGLEVETTVISYDLVELDTCQASKHAGVCMAASNNPGTMTWLLDDTCMQDSNPESSDMTATCGSEHALKKRAQ